MTNLPRRQFLKIAGIAAIAAIAIPFSANAEEQSEFLLSLFLV